MATGVGILGKLPSRGDFPRRDLPAEPARPLDDWVAAAVAASRAAFLEAPVWCFALAAGSCGPSARAGLRLPSVDRVGRRVPLLLVALLAAARPPVALLRGAGALWWGKGSPRVAPSLLACPGLPPPSVFAAMRDGGFAAHGWTEPRS